MRLRTTIVVAVAGALLGIATGCGAKAAAHSARRLVYSVSSDSGTDSAGLFLVDADGTQRTQLTRPSPWADKPSWSPAGDKILFINGSGPGGEVWTINPDGSDARKIGDGTAASWSHDGREIAVVQKNADMAVFSSDGTRLRTIDLGIDPRQFSIDPPTWSPDRRQLAFAVESDHYGPIYVASVDGKGKARPLATGLGEGVYDVDPVWSPDSEKVAFTRTYPNDSREEVWTSRTDGSDHRLVAAGAHVFAWSPDGKALICSHGAYHPLYSHPLGGGAPRRLSAAEENRIDVQGRVSFSPDGKRLVTIDKADGLVVSRADGSEPKRLTNPAEELSPDWSPDGMQVAFVRANEIKYETHDNTVYVIGADGKAERKIIAGIETCRECGTAEFSPDGTALTIRGVLPDGIDVVGLNPVVVKRIGGARSPAWSPGGKTIAFVRDLASNDKGEWRSTLYTVRRDGTGLRALATSADGKTPANFDSPVWMPDGQSILIEEVDPSEGGVDRVLKIPVAGGKEQTIATDKGGFGNLSVSPDGKTLAFVSDKGIETMTIASGERKLIAKSTDPQIQTVEDPAWSPDSKELGYLSLSKENKAKLYVVRQDGTAPQLISKPDDIVMSFDWRPEAAPAT